MKKTPRPPKGESGGAFNFCEKKERKNLYEELEFQAGEIQRELLKKKKISESFRVRVVFTFTDSRGRDTLKYFRDLDTVRHFLYADIYPGMKHGVPDWSPQGLCQYQKKVTIGVMKMRGQALMGFDKTFRIVEYLHE